MAHCRQFVILSRQPLALYKHQMTNCDIPVAHCKRFLDAEHEGTGALQTSFGAVQTTDRQHIAEHNWGPCRWPMAHCRQLVTLSRRPLALYKHQIINRDIPVAICKRFWTQSMRELVHCRRQLAQRRRPTGSTLQSIIGAHADDQWHIADNL
jgi:hypothetical protein